MKPVKARLQAGMRPPAARFSLILLSGLVAAGALLAYSLPSTGAPATPGISSVASARCARKVAALQERAAATGAQKKQTTRITEEELNSFLALELKAKYHPCLKNMEFHFEKGKLTGVAAIDFDKLSMNSTKIVSRMLAALLSGIHNLSMTGILEANGGKARFVLEEAKFDSTTLPNFLVEQIISAVGKKQRPPFDPVTPSTMPYGIEKAEVGAGYILIYQ
jgi:hypothetical protein